MLLIMLEKINELARAAAADLDNVADADALEAYRIRYLGSKGAVKSLMGLIKDVPKDAKREFGQQANAARAAIEQAFAERAEAVGGHASGDSGDSGDSGGGGGGAGPSKSASGPPLDITEPGTPPRRGRKHVITQTVDELIDVFGRMGFDVATGPEVEDDYHNFVALNIPDTHPARDPLDNFYLQSEPAKPQAANPALMRSQTSTVQIRVMENTQPPIRIISTGRVYRPDAHDATHSSMFHQIEGLYVDRHVTMVDLKTTLIQFARAYWGQDAEVKLVPSYFPFTEPSAELYVKIDLGKGPEWMEVGGCGMVDPAVFEQVGYDPEQWTGFAFGLGIERLAMRKHHIADIRWLYEGDVRFLRQL
jgi:phenylalanyl-tRNA synthetase alpha chain